MAERAGRYLCVARGHIYEPERGEPKRGIAAGTAFRDLPDNYMPCLRRLCRGGETGLHRHRLTYHPFFLYTVSPFAPGPAPQGAPSSGRPLYSPG
ncbi:MAG: rubredoxin [Methanoculleus sp.]|nr:rubredoxin [Methanoculleus sp. UBA303]MDD3932781.1 rubredoxin [Methanoculleus sp.]